MDRIAECRCGGHPRRSHRTSDGRCGGRHRGLSGSPMRRWRTRSWARTPTHDAEQMASWIQREELTVFTLRDAHRRFRKPSPQDLLPALDVLELRGYIRPTEVPKRNGPGRKPSPRYEVNPAALIGERKPGEHDIQPVAPPDTPPAREREPGDDDDSWGPS